MKLYNEIKKEVIYFFWLFVIIIWGMMFCDIANRQAIWDYEFENWEYNIDCPVPDGWSRAIIDTNKK